MAGEVICAERFLSRAETSRNGSRAVLPLPFRHPGLDLGSMNIAVSAFVRPFSWIQAFVGMTDEGEEACSRPPYMSG